MLENEPNAPWTLQAFSQLSGDSRPEQRAAVALAELDTAIKSDEPSEKKLEHLLDVLQNEHDGPWNLNAFSRLGGEVQKRTAAGCNGSMNRLWLDGWADRIYEAAFTEGRNAASNLDAVKTEVHAGTANDIEMLKAALAKAEAALEEEKVARAAKPGLAYISEMPGTTLCGVCAMSAATVCVPCGAATAVTTKCRENERLAASPPNGVSVSATKNQSHTDHERRRPRQRKKLDSKSQQDIGRQHKKSAAKATNLQHAQNRSMNVAHQDNVLDRD